MRGKFVFFHLKDTYLTKGISTEINSNANFDTCSERIKFTKHFNMNCCCDVLSMTSARALHVRFMNYKEVKL